MSICYYKIRNDVSVRKVGEKFFIINPHFDYTKDKMPEITQLGVNILEKIKKTHSEKIIQSEFGQKAIDFLNYLFERGYVLKWTPSHSDNFISDIVKTKWSETRTFYGCTFELTPSCNFNCIHCYLDGIHTAKDILSGTQIKEIIDKLYQNGLMLIFFSGGDPFLHPDFKDIYVYTRRNILFKKMSLLP